MEKDLNLKNKSAKGNADVLPLVCHKFRESESLLVVSKHDREIKESTRPLSQMILFVSITHVSPFIALSLSTLTTKNMSSYK